MKRILTTACLLLLSLITQAESTPDGVLKAMDKLMPGINPEWVKPAPMTGFNEVVYGPHLFYISSDGQFLLRGDVLDLTTNENLTRPMRKKARLAAIESLGEDSMIVYEPKQALHTVTIFTDIDCGYCRKLHSELQDYLDRGIRIRYLAYPRAGIPSTNYDETVSVWCSKDQQKALTDAKAERHVEQSKCDNPVADHFEMGRMIGVRGTPTIILDSGDIIPGYVPADALNTRLNQAGSKG